MLGALGRIWALMGASGLDFNGFQVPPGCVFELWESSRRFLKTMLELLQGAQRGIHMGISSPLAARRYVRCARMELPCLVSKSA